MQAGVMELGERYGSYQTLINLADHKGKLDAMLGPSVTVTDHPTGEVLYFMAYQADYAQYQKRLSDARRPKAK